MNTRIAAVILALLTALPAANAQTTYWLPTSKVTVTETTYDFNTKAPDYLVDWLKTKTPIGGGDIVAKTIKGKQYQFVKQTVSWPKPLQSGMWIEKDSSPTKFGVGEWKSNNDLKAQSAVIKALESNVKHSIATHAKAEVLVLIHQEDTPPGLVFTAKASDFNDSKTVATAPKPAPAPMPQPAPATDPAVLAFDPPSLAFVWQKGGPNPASQSVLGRNAKGNTGWHPGQWMNPGTTSWVPGGLQMNISVSPATAGLDVGVHDTKLVLESNGMKATLPIKITVVSADGTLQVNRKRLHFGGFLGDAIKEQVIDLTYTGVGNTNWTASGPAWLKLSQGGGTVAATDPTTLSVGINTAAITAAGRISGTLTVRDGKTTHEIPVDLSVVPAGSPTIELYGLEVTQGIQNLLNDIPFVANRPTFVRGHVRSLTGDPIEKVSAQLIGTRDGTNLGTLAPINPGGSINIIADPDRGKLDESFLFELPPAWLTGKVTLHLEGKSHPIAYADPAEKTAAASDADSLATSAGTKDPKMTATKKPTDSQVAQGDWQEKWALTHNYGTAAALSLAWSPNSEMIAARYKDKILRVWDATTGKHKLTPQAYIDGRFLGWQENTGLYYSTTSVNKSAQPGDYDLMKLDISSHETKSWETFPSIRDYSYVSNKLAFAKTDSVEIRDGLSGGRLSLALQDAYRLAWSPDCSKIAAAAPFNAVDAKTGRKVYVWEYATGAKTTGNLQATINAPLIEDLVWSSDGAKIAAAADSKSGADEIHVWDAKTGKELVTINDPGAHELTWSPNGSKIATGCNSDYSAGVGKVWNGATGAALYTLKGASKVRAGQWSPDGSKIATQGRNDLGIWNAENGDSLHQQRFDSQIHDVAWSPDGSRIAVALGNGTVRVLAAPIAPTPKPAIPATTPKPASPTITAKPDDGTVTLTFQTIPALPIEYYLYSEQGSVKLSDGRQVDMTYTANAAYAAATSQQLLAGLPIPRVDDTIHPTTSTYSGNRIGNQGKVDAIMRETYKKAGSPLRHTYGLFARYEPPTDPKAQPVGGPGGAACVPGFFGFGEYYTFQPMETLNMHEIGHNLGRNHVDCGKPASPDLAFPHKNHLISDELSGPAAYYGFNIVTKKDIYPPTYKDYMSYCHPSWISPYTYKAMIERLKIHYKKPDGAGGQTAGSPGAPILLVSGSVTGAGTATMAGSVDSVADDNASAAIPIPVADGSKYSVRLLDASGGTIATYPVTPETSDPQAAEGHDHDEFTSFTLAVLRPEKMARVVLLHENKPLAERKASANPPTVTLTTPLVGQVFGNQAIPLTWKAGDVDGNELRFNVDYSINDGTTWHVLARNWSETTLQVDSSRLAGSAKARLRVSANDGFLTTFAVSDAFTVSDHPPVAIILSKDLNRYYVGGQTILLKGTGYDFEDGVVNELTWYSDRNGKLGTGRTLSLNADDLAEGAHVIRLEAKDRKGQSSFGDPVAGVAAIADDSFAASDSVRFNVHLDPLSVPAELLAASVMSGKTQRIEAETGTYTGGARTDSSNKGFEGTGFAAYFLPGAEVALNVTTDQAGVHDLVIRYAAGQHGPESTRTLSLYVNGSRTRQLSFERTGNWLNWANQTAKVQLKSGENKISFRVDKGDTGYINLDYLILGVEKSPRLRVNPGLTNSSFEEPRGKEASFVLVETMPGWKTTDTHFEIWGTGFKDVAAHEGTQFVELNAYIDGTLYQDSTGIQPDSVLEFTFAHRGRNGKDTMKLTITDLGKNNSLGGGDDTVLFTKEYSTGKDAWAVYNSTKEKQIKALGNTVRFAYRAISSATGELGEGNFLDAADFGVGVVTSHPTLAPVKHEAAYGTKRLHTFGVGGKSSENHYLGVRNSQVGIPDEKNPSSGDIFVLNVKQTDNGAVLTNQAGKYLTARGKEVVLSDTPEQGSYWLIRDPKKSDVRASDGWFSLELASDPGRYLRHFQLKAFAHKEEELGQNEKSLFLPDATWRFVDAKTFEYSMEVISGNGQSYGGGGMPDAMVIRIKDKSGKPVTNLKDAGLTIDVSANTPGTYDSAFSNLSVKRNDKTLFEGYYYVPGNKGAPYTLQITVQLKKAGDVVGECIFKQNIK